MSQKSSKFTTPITPPELPVADIGKGHENADWIKRKKSREEELQIHRELSQEYKEKEDAANKDRGAE